MKELIFADAEQAGKRKQVSKKFFLAQTPSTQLAGMLCLQD
jgi:hypothetical protein